MNTLYRAYQYLKHKRLKTFLLLLVIIIFSSLVLFSLVLQSTSDAALTSISKENGVLVGTRENQLFAGRNKELTEQELHSISQLPYVTQVIKTNTSSVFNKLETEEDKLSLFGSNAVKFDDLFSKGVGEIKKGELPVDDDSLVVSQAFADKYNLDVGDTLKLTSQLPNKGTSKPNSEQFLITGIWEYTQKATQEDIDASGGKNILADIKAVDALNSGINVSQPNYQFVIDNARDFEKFKKDYARILQLDEEDIQFTINDEAFRSIVQPLEKLQSTVNLVRNLIVLLAIIFIAIIWILTMRERKQEIAVLYSLGETKFQIIGQFVSEAILLTFGGFAISVIVTVSLSKTLLSFLSTTTLAEVSKNSLTQMMNQPSGQTLKDIPLQINVLSMFVALAIIIIIITLLNIVIVGFTLRKPIREIFYK
ncbi:ABC transporter permease (plasmid) [Lactococcus garvieae]|uniref:ABC transporter permease n=1 Tax=Lactococcus garvieae TaxID=1363 RepID=UPI0030CD45AC